MPAVKQWVVPIRVPLRDAAGKTRAVMGAGYRMDGGTGRLGAHGIGARTHRHAAARRRLPRLLHPLPGAAGNELFERIYGRPVEADLIGRLRAQRRDASIVNIALAGRDMLAAWEPLDDYGLHALTMKPLDQVRRDQIASLMSPTLWLLAFLAGGFLIYRHTQRLQAESDRQVHDLTAARQAILDGANYMIVATDRDGVITSFNQAGERMLGYSAGELIGARTPLLWHDAEEVARRAEEISTELGKPLQQDFGVLVVRAAAGHAEEHEWTFIARDGRRFPVLLSISQIQGADGEIAGFIGITRDITERKQAEEKLQLAASVFTHAREGIIITDADGTIIEVNDAFTRITGYSRDEVLGQNPRILSSGRQNKEFYAAMWRDLIEKGHWYGEIWNRRKNGEVYAEMLTISAVRDAQGEIQQYVALFSDITALKEHEQQLEHIAHYDALTDLPNRVLLADRLQQAMAQAQRRGAAAGRGLSRPGRLQGHQRPPRARSRRPVADRPGQPHEAGPARRRHPGPPRRRRVRRRAARPGRRRAPACRCSPGCSPPRPQPVQVGDLRPPGLGQPRRHLLPAGRGRRCRPAAAPGRPGHVPGQAGRQEPLPRLRRRAGPQRARPSRKPGAHSPRARPSANSCCITSPR